MSSNTKQHWETVYETKTPEQVSWTQEIPETSLNFINSFQLSKEVKIIDIGGGDSHLVDFLLEQGYTNITVLDISKKALQRAQERLGKKANLITWIVSDVLDFIPDTSYDIWHDRAAFHFLTKENDIKTYVLITEKHVTKNLIIGTFSNDFGDYKIIVSIGDPQRRFEEDPVRCLRAIRFSNKLDFKIDNDIKEAIYDKGHLLSDISNARLFDEFCKIYLGGMGEKNFVKLNSFNLNKYLLLSDPNKSDFANSVMVQALRNTDDRIKNEQSTTPGFLMAALLWPTLLSKCTRNGEVNIRKFFRSMDDVLRDQQRLTAIPRKFNSYIKDIWVLQLKLHSRIGSQPYKTLRHPRFRAAYDFLLVRERAAADKGGLGKWWTDFQKDDDSLRGSIISNMNEKDDAESGKIFGFYNELR